MPWIHDKFVRETEKEKEIYREAERYLRGNPCSGLSPQMGSLKAASAFLDQTVSELINKCVPLDGTRWSFHKNENIRPSYSVAGFSCIIMTDILNCIANWTDINDDVCWRVQDSHTGEYTKMYTDAILFGPKKKIRLHFDLSPCTVPKKIARSRTDGLRIDHITWEDDCTLREFFGEVNVKKMQETLLVLWLDYELQENKIHPYSDTQEEIVEKAKHLIETTGKFLEEEGKVEKDRETRKKTEIQPLLKPELHEVIITRPDKVVLDIGLVDSVNDDGTFTVLARCTSLYGGDNRHYGGIDYCKWYHTGVSMSPETWKDVSMDETVEGLCHLLGIPYNNSACQGEA